jgi:hypothetical protein
MNIQDDDEELKPLNYPIIQIETPLDHSTPIQPTPN